jgi:hypothetical protein
MKYKEDNMAEETKATVTGEVVSETAVTEPQAMEFRLINPTEGGFLRHIDWNRQELEAAVRAKVAAYENVVYTEDSIKDAKADRAELNKLSKAIEDCRKKVKNTVMEPYNTFEGEVKEVLQLIAEPVGMIDKQVKAFEERQKEEKKAAIRATFDEIIGDLAEVLPFEKVFDSRYLNQTYKLAAAQTEIRERVERVRRDLETIDALDSKYKLNAKDVYIKTMDLSKALAENKRLSDLEEKLEAEKRRKEQEEAERKRIEEEKRLQEEEEKKALAAETQRKAEEEEESAAETQQPESEMGRVVDSIQRETFNAVVSGENAQPEAEAETAVDPFIPKQEEKKYKVRFCAVGSREQLAKLTEYMNNNGIKYGRI